MANSESIVSSISGRTHPDRAGAAVSTVRLNPEKAYHPIPLLLKEFIDEGSAKAWEEIRRRIDYLYSAVTGVMESLDAAEPFSPDVLKEIRDGKKLFFKPNLVSLPSLDPRTHGPVATGTCVPWEFVATIMRWFHDRRGVSYYQMAIGEAGVQTSGMAAMASDITRQPVSTQAFMEGKWGDHYGGWGFYFARKYLAECHPSTHTDDPMHGYVESCSGVCIPMGRAGDRLLVYDLNKISNDLSDGRDVPVPDGVNYRTITLHKALVGGDPANREDRREWPGSVIVNVAKLKIHAIELFTAALKNLGIGFYPMEAREVQGPGKTIWKYAGPDGTIPLVKVKLPHRRWMVQCDWETGAPFRNSQGKYEFIKTGGLEATIADAVRAVQAQGVRMVHVIDAVECSNIHHFGPPCKPTPEGLIFASQDIIAIDSCASRYLFNMVPAGSAEEVRRDYHLTSDVIQESPRPQISGANIVTGKGYDSSFSRYGTLRYGEKRGLGQRKYHVIGKDLWKGGRLISLKQRLCRQDKEGFSELVTGTLYHTPNKPLWDLQAASLAYLECSDQLTGSHFRKEVLDAFDENGDGIIDYSEKGKEHFDFFMAYSAPGLRHDMDTRQTLKFNFLVATSRLKLIKSEWNSDRHDIGWAAFLAQSLGKAFELAASPKEMPDPFFPSMACGKGRWPSFQFAMYRQMMNTLYGQEFPDRIDNLTSVYGMAWRYAASSPFKLFVPSSYGKMNGQLVPNVEETDDPDLIFTALFSSGECWKEFRVSECRLKL